MEGKIYFCQECLKRVVTELEKEYTLQKTGKILCWDCLKKIIVLGELQQRDKKKEVIEEAIERLREENIKVKMIEDIYGGKEEEK